jgi:hypothetical protein
VRSYSIVLELDRTFYSDRLQWSLNGRFIFMVELFGIKTISYQFSYGSDNLGDPFRPKPDLDSLRSLCQPKRQKKSSSLPCIVLTSVGQCFIAMTLSQRANIH